MGAYGISDKFELGGKFTWMGEMGTDVFNFLVAPKISLIPEKLAVTAQTGLILVNSDGDTGGELNNAWLTMPGVVFTHSFSSMIDLTVNPKAVLTFSDNFDEYNVAGGVNLAVRLAPAGERWSVMPEVGFLYDDDTDGTLGGGYFLQIGLGFSWQLGDLGPAAPAPAPVQSAPPPPPTMPPPAPAPEGPGPGPGPAQARVPNPAAPTPTAGPRPRPPDPLRRPAACRDNQAEHRAVDPVRDHHRRRAAGSVVRRAGHDAERGDHPGVAGRPDRGAERRTLERAARQRWTTGSDQREQRASRGAEAEVGEGREQRARPRRRMHAGAIERGVGDRLRRGNSSRPRRCAASITADIGRVAAAPAVAPCSSFRIHAFMRTPWPASDGTQPPHAVSFAHAASAVQLGEHRVEVDPGQAEPGRELGRDLALLGGDGVVGQRDREREHHDRLAARVGRVPIPDQLANPGDQRREPVGLEPLRRCGQDRVDPCRGRRPRGSATGRAARRTRPRSRCRRPRRPGTRR